MLIKPDAFRGEAYPFENWLNVFFYEDWLLYREEGGQGWETGRATVNAIKQKIKTSHVFFMQDFESEMIGEYFKTIEQIEEQTSDNYYIDKNDREYYWLILPDVDGIKRMEIRLVQKDGKRILNLHNSLIPKTLNQFVLDCKRIGVPLCWKY
jgi:hypothetical protein